MILMVLVKIESLFYYDTKTGSVHENENLFHWESIYYDSNIKNENLFHNTTWTSP